MRIVIDMQATQTESRFRGIGRYTMAFTQAVIRNHGTHEIILALNDLFPETIEPIRAAFDGLIPQENIRVWRAPSLAAETHPSNDARRDIAELVREAFLASLKPDVVHICSLFEGFSDNAVSSVGRFDRTTPVSVTLYDLIPLLDPDRYLTFNRCYAQYYLRKVNHLKNAACLLTISESARQEGLLCLKTSTRKIVNISGSIDPQFRPLLIDEDLAAQVYHKYGLTRPFILYTGGADERKNLPRLFQAFATLPAHLRKAHQLLLVGKMPDGNISELKRQAKIAGLNSNELLFTGFVNDEELVRLYNLCKLFIFPSWHEGFGLPPLEAMACGAPVIAANTTSLPEIIGLDDALFDPFDIPAIAAMMGQALEDSSFRRALCEHGLRQAKRFSWDETARKAITVWESVWPQSSRRHYPGIKIDRTEILDSRKKRILVLKLDHMGDMILAIPAISKLRSRYPTAHIDALVGSWNHSIAQDLGIFNKVLTFDYFGKKSADSPRAVDAEIEMVLRHMGEYDIAIDLRRQRDTRHILVKVCAKLKIGYTSFDENIDRSLDVVIPAYPDEQFKPSPMNKTSIALQMIRVVDALPYATEDFICVPKSPLRPSGEASSVAIFPFAGNDIREWGVPKYRQLVERLCSESEIKSVNVYVSSEPDIAKLALPNNSKLCIHVGLPTSDLRTSLLFNSVCVANNSFGAHMASYLGLIVIGIYGGQETVGEWAPIFPDSYVIHTASKCSPCHIARRADCPYGMQCLEDIPVDLVHEKIMEATRFSYETRFADANMPAISLTTDLEDIKKDLISAIATLNFTREMDDLQLTNIAQCIGQSLAADRATRQLLVDISELVRYDAKTGIQRVVRSILGELLRHPPSGYQVEPVYATMEHGYRYARRFTQTFLGCQTGTFDDEYIDYAPGDIFLGLDLQLQLVPIQRDFYQTLRRWGVQVYFLVYDLLSIQMPQYFPEGNAEGFSRWLNVVMENEGAVCISSTVAQDLAEWIKNNGHGRTRPLKIDWFHLGANIEKSSPSVGIPENAETILHRLRSRPTFLMVGTLEPRKGHAQVLQAFEQLWENKFDINLVIVGKVGWIGEHFIKCLREHPERDNRLYWLEAISDEYLEKIYAVSICFIAASYGEGFGLPLIEAAQHNLSILARDIPIFREVARNYASYFRGDVPQDVELAVRRWLVEKHEGTAPQSKYIPRLTWAESNKMLLEVLNLSLKTER